MRIKSILLASTAIIALNSPAFAVEKETYESKTKIEKDSDGNYQDKDTVKRIDTDGTKTISEKSLKIKVDENGATIRNADTKTVVDPKGLGNKHVVKTSDSEKNKDGKVISKSSKVIKGENPDGTKDSYKTESTIKSDAEGNYKEKDKTTATDAEGTTTKFEKNANVDVDSKGNIEKTTTTKEVTDPKGLYNKHTVTTSNKETIKDGTVNTSHEIKVNGKVIESKSDTSSQKK